MSKQTITIYSPVRSERLLFACNVIFKVVLNSEYEIISNIELLKGSSKGLHINYSDKNIINTFQVVPSGLLFETTIEKQDLFEGKTDNLPVIFYSGKGDISYDIFSAVFYMVSRYEEYLDYSPDQHGRYKAEESIAYKMNFLHLPIVEMWIYNLAAKLKIKPQGLGYKQQLTIDIDNAWKYINKGFLKTFGGMFVSFISGRFQETGDRIATVSGRKKDPGDTYDYLNNIEEKLIQPIQYFILVGRKRKHDNALSIYNQEYKNLLLRINQKNRPGFHPSYESNKSLKILQNEYFKLCSIFTRRIVKSRQHYLKFRFPETFRNLIKLSIREEHSLGWSSQIGFRAGISRPFPFFDLQKNKQTHLMLVPFMVMDRTLKDYLRLSPQEAIVKVKELCDAVKKVNGQFTVLWHNDSLSDIGEWKGWQRVFEETVLYAERN
jgi:hypothetical protein